MILAIEREWGKEPGWFASLERVTRAELLADWEIRHTSKKPTAPAPRTVRGGRRR